MVWKCPYGCSVSEFYVDTEATVNKEGRVIRRSGDDTTPYCSECGDKATWVEEPN